MEACFVKICVWDTNYFLIKSKFGKNVEHSKSIEHSQKRKPIGHAKAQHVGHLKVAEGQKVECFQTNWISMPRHSMINIRYYLNILKKQNLLNIQWRSQHWTPSTSILWCLPEWFQGIFLIWKLSRAHGALDKGSNIENFYSAKKQGECLNK